MRRSQHRRWRNLQHRALRRLLAASAAHGFAAEEAAVTLVLHAFELNHAATAALATMARNRRAAAAIDIAVATAEYLNAHFRERVALADLAAHTGYSVFHRCRMLQARMKTSLSRYLDDLRLEAALEALLESDAGVMDLALEHGFASHSRFSKSVRRWCGCWPSEARRRGRGQRARTH
jgi:AraC-like DNA-binding protein